ncbi:MAG: hypothetical protein ACTSXO_00955 [Candidatus Heimdallarchaeota archaeon]|nr:MAG: hypothetical protein DRO63_04825 [Candidatus Gerdarchaeota archaeon]RLI70832.1 MAG: hypothetical protein DRP02_06670 [Candidatus Gerdarchaeota archaeon]
MADLVIKCICGETFTYSINLAPFIEEFETAGEIPLIIPHKDHFVTAYIDRQFKIKSVERIIMVDKHQRSTIVSSETISENEIKRIIDNVKQEINLHKDYLGFAQKILDIIQEPEALFIAGRQMGYEMWREMRKSILKLGATYQPKINLILKTELKPILDKTGKTRLEKDNQLEVDQVIAPQLVVGLAQGILLAIGETAEEKMDIKIEYTIEGNKVDLILKNE